MDDLISRKAAIEAINALHELPNAWLDYAVDVVMALPSAQPQRKKGKWLSVSDETQTWYHCSECHYQQYDKTNFCPSCGARMDGESDE